MEPRGDLQRAVVTAKLKLGSSDAGAEIIRHGPPFDLDQAGFLRHGVYLGTNEVIFYFEGYEVEKHVRRLLNDPATSASFAVWAPLLEGTPTAAHELFFWEAEGGESGRIPPAE